MKTKKSISAFVVCFILLILGLTSYELYNSFLTSPKKIFSQNIKNLNKKYTLPNLKINDFSYEGDLSFHIQSNLNEIIDENYNLDNYLDFIDKTNINYTLKKEKETFKALVNIGKNKATIDFTEKGYYLSFNKQKLNITDEVNLIKKYLLLDKNKLLKEFIDKLDDSHFTKEKVTINNEKLTKNSLVIDDKLLKELFKEKAFNLNGKKIIVNTYTTFLGKCVLSDIVLADFLKDEIKIEFTDMINVYLNETHTFSLETKDTEDGKDFIFLLNDKELVLNYKEENNKFALNINSGLLYSNLLSLDLQVNGLNSKLKLTTSLLGIELFQMRILNEVQKI